METTFSQRLKSARIMRGLSMDELAARMQGAVSKQAISKYELGKMMPGSDTLQRLSDALQLPIDYFFRDGIELGPISFRRDYRLPEQSTRQMEYIARDKLERYLTIEDLLSLHHPFVNPLRNIKIDSFEAVERAADALRKKWELGIQPISSVYGVLEHYGVKLVEIAVPSADVLGFSSLVKPGIPLIVVNLTANTTVERKRFTALHELAHLLLRFPADPPKTQQERYCHRFAGAVLCPSVSFRQEMGERRSALTLDELIHIRERYGISIAATVHRAHDLDIITDTYYNKIFDERIHANRLEEGWGHYPIEEVTTRFERLLQRAVAEQVISMSRAAELANEKLGDYRERLMKA
jgi:Zn-dependent peptidase ImmA (M78 family)/DNA-binding XRE family transcriptional regulator